MSVRRGSAASYVQVRRGLAPVREIRRGSTLVWSGARITDGFDFDGWLENWINELCGDPGQLISNGIGLLVDGLDNFIGQTVSYAERGINELGMLVAGTGTQLVDAYCGAWGGTAPPNGLIGLINGIPIFGGPLGDLLTDFFSGTVVLDSIIGQIPIVGGLAEQLGMIPDQLGNLLEPLNYVVDTFGDVIGTITCGVFNPTEGAAEGICYVIGVVGQAARMLIPDGIMSLNLQTARFRHPTTLLADDGWLETQIAELGDPGFATQVFRRYANDGTGDRGVGIDFRDSMTSLVRRVGGVETIVAPNLGPYAPADQFRLIQTGNLHTLYRNGDSLGGWDDTTATAASGATNRSVAMLMQGAKEMLSVRRFSPTLAYLEAG